MDFITLYNMAGLTLQQLQGMGAKPVTGGFTANQMTNMGAKPVGSSFDQAQSSLGHSSALLQNVNNAQRMQTISTGSAGQSLSSAPATLEDTEKDFGGFASKVLPAAGAVAGGLGGAALGGLVAAPTVAGVPAGAFAGGALGAGVGASAGEALSEKMQGQDLSPSDIGKTGLEYGALEGVGGPAISLAGKGLEAAGKGIAESFIPTSAKEANLLQTYKANTSFWDRIKNIAGIGNTKAPTTAASTAFDKGLVGTQSMIGVRAKRAANNLWSDLLAPALKQSKVGIDMPNFFNNIETTIKSQNPELSRQKSLLDALDSLREDYKGKDFANLQELQDFKKGWAQFIPDKAYRGQPIAGAFKDVSNLAASQARKTIYDVLGPEVKQGYLDYGNLESLQELGKQAMTGSKLKGGSFTGLHALWDMATIPVGTTGGQTIYKVGKGIELVGKPGARTIRDAIGIPLGFGEDSNQSQ